MRFNHRLCSLCLFTSLHFLFTISTPIVSSSSFNTSNTKLTKILPRVRPDHTPQPPESSPWDYRIAYYGLPLRLPSLIREILYHLEEFPPSQMVPFVHIWDPNPNLPDSQGTITTTSTSNQDTSELPSESSLDQKSSGDPSRLPTQWSYLPPRSNGIAFTVTKYRDGIYRYKDLVETMHAMWESQRVNGYRYETSVFVYERERGAHFVTVRLGWDGG